MTFSIAGIIVLVVVGSGVVWLIGNLAYPAVFRYILLPRLASKYGWRIRKKYRPPRDLPGDGSQSWEVPLPDTACEFLGHYRGRPVHGVEVRVSTGKSIYDAVSGTWSKDTKYYSVVTVAMTDRPFEGFHDRNRVVSLNGDPIALYPDFADWARNRKTESRKPVRVDDFGLRSISWRGSLSGKRIRRALDELTGDA